jgi:hypothetical protein
VCLYFVRRLSLDFRLGLPILTATTAAFSFKFMVRLRWWISALIVFFFGREEINQKTQGFPT